METPHLDFIGDIHGHLECLENLLKKLGYEKSDGVFVPPKGRRAVFLGDYIDRGPNSRGVYHLIRRMKEKNFAIALLGNHELNALAFWTKKKNEDNFFEPYYREHTFNKVMIHAETLSSFRSDGTFDGEREFFEMLSFFRTLPLFFETEFFRAAHACIDIDSIRFLQKEGVENLSDDFILHQTLDEKGHFFKAVDTLLKGPEMKLPEGISFRDSENVLRKKTRIRWWVDPSQATMQSLSLQPGIKLPEIPVPEIFQTRPFYGRNEMPAFFGHYWLFEEEGLFENNVCCLDYSVASRFRPGKLAAYRFDGEKTLSKNKLVFFDPYAP